MLQGMLILLVFVLSAIGMMSKKLPALIALPLMAVLIAIISKIPFNEILTTIIGGGAVRLSSAMAAAMFGGMLSQVINRTGIANSIIKRAAELAGDNPMIVAFVIAAAVAFVFTSIGGLGAIIMVGTIVLPIMISVGINALLAASIMLISFKIGLLFNMYNYAFYSDVLGIPIADLKIFALVYGAITAIATIVFIIFNVRKSKTRTAWAMPNANMVKQDKKNVPIYALITPIIPILLVFIWNVNVIAAIIVGALYGILTTKPKEIVNILSSSFIEGIKDVAPAVALMIGIGMVLLAVMNEATASIMQPIIAAVVPSSKISYILFFALLSPLALYRGPLNLWGLGSGIAGLMLATGSLSPMVITAALLALSAVQDVADPTNTHNVWICNFVEVDTSTVLKKVFPYVFGVAVLCLIYTTMFIW
ncbi:transporter [Abyssisolibacter fermentans]|uniref:transporter n=1 Tax=Abyssisolibacter fermentans TaxID=1766203 RepID=UPI0008369DB3|nr:transporter [Abyssisolibacter fermentans]